MSDKQETIADIIAEKWRIADEIERNCAEKMKRGEMVSDRYARELVTEIRREANRLEAAHERELAAARRPTLNGASAWLNTKRGRRPESMDHIDKDEELVCPLCGGDVLWMPVSRIYVCEHCKQSYSEGNVVYLQKKRKATAEKSSAGGNAAKLREALLEARRFVFTSAHRTDRDLLVTDDEERGPYVLTPKETLVKIDAALAEPVKNCEVGTAEEQDARFESFCDAHRCFSCPAKTPRSFLSTCALKWTQMPYEADAQKGGEG